MLKDALTHTKKTGYDRRGKLVAMLSKAEMATRYHLRQQEQLPALLPARPTTVPTDAD